MPLNDFGHAYRRVIDSDAQATLDEIVSKLDAGLGALHKTKSVWKYQKPGKRVGLALTRDGANTKYVFHAHKANTTGQKRAKELNLSYDSLSIETIIPEGQTKTPDEDDRPHPSSLGRRVRPGASTSHEKGYPGTVGCVVRWRTPEGSEQVGFVTASHVIGRFNKANQNVDAVLMPALDDLQNPDSPSTDDRVGIVDKYILLNEHDEVDLSANPARLINKTDVGRVSVDLSRIHDEENAVPISSEETVILKYPSNDANIFDYLGQAVFKVGRTTGLTYGVLKYISLDQTVFRHNVNVVGVKSVYIYDDLLIVASAGDAAFSRPGDSGACVYLNDGTIIGFIVGGDGYYTYVTPVQTAFNRLGVDLYES